MNYHSILTFLVLSCTTSGLLCAEDWTNWRGPHGNGISESKTKLPVTFSKDKNVAWRLELPGSAGATPVIVGEKIFLTTVENDKLILMCVSTSGKEIWRKQVGQGNKNFRVDEGNMASPSPVTDGKHVWAAMSNGDVACFDLDGKKIWSKNLQTSYGKFRIQFGMSSSPVLYKENIYFQLIHGEGSAKTNEAAMVALEKMTGKEVWKTSRVTGARAENEHSYASPILYQFGDLEFLISHGADYTIGHDLMTGKEIWRLGGLNPHDDPKRRYHPTLRFVATPAAAKGIIICPTAKNGPIFAIRPDLKGDLTNNEKAFHWKRAKNTPDVPSPLIHDGLVYLCRENGTLLVLDEKSGEEIYSERVHDRRHRSSPVFADGKIYLCGRDGVVSVIKAGRKFEVLGQSKLGEVIAASPAISDGTIYLRTFDALWAIKQQ